MNAHLLSPDLFIELLDESPSFLLVLKKGHIQYANKTFRDTLGEAILPQILAAIDPGYVGQQIQTLRLTNQRSLVIHWHCRMWPVGDGLSCQLLIGEDRTVQDSLKRRINLLNSIVRKVPGFVFWKDQQCTLMGCNENFARQVGLNDPDEIVGLTDEDLPWDPEQTQKFHQDDQDVLTQGIQKLNIEEQQRQRDGRELSLITSKVPLYEQNQIIGLLGIYMDITALKATEKALREQKEKAEVANRMKSDFILNMQHDIRMPIAGIQGLCEWLLTQSPPENLMTSLAEIAKAAKELLDYCNELVDFSRAEYGAYPLTKQPFSLSALVSELIDMQRPAAEVKHLRLSVQCDPQAPDVVLGDLYRIKRILLNLLSNAIKFTDQGSVQLSIHPAEPLKRHRRKIIVQFMVADTGIGMASEQLDRIYEKFSRLTLSHKGLYKGQGLGLNRVKQFVEDLEGDIHVQSQINRGTTFSVFLPLCLPWSPKILPGGHSS